MPELTRYEQLLLELIEDKQTAFLKWQDAKVRLIRAEYIDASGQKMTTDDYDTLAHEEVTSCIHYLDTEFELGALQMNKGIYLDGDKAVEEWEKWKRGRTDTASSADTCTEKKN